MLQGGESCSACTGEEQLGLGMGSRCMWAVSPNTIMTHIGEAGGGGRGADMENSMQSAGVCLIFVCRIATPDK